MNKISRNRGPSFGFIVHLLDYKTRPDQIYECVFFMVRLKWMCMCVCVGNRVRLNPAAVVVADTKLS